MTRPPAASDNISPIATRRAVVTSSRGNHTNANRWRPSGERTSTSLGRGRSARLIAVSASCSTAAGSIAASRSCGNDASACINALPVWPAGSNPNLSSNSANRWRSTGTLRGGALSAAEVHSPAVIDKPVTRPACITGTTRRSSGTRRWTGEIRLDFSSSGALLPAWNHSTARWRERSARNGTACALRMMPSAPATSSPPPTLQR